MLQEFDTKAEAEEWARRHIPQLGAEPVPMDEVDMAENVIRSLWALVAVVDGRRYFIDSQGGFVLVEGMGNMGEQD
jgi:hypothetical protein